MSKRKQRYTARDKSVQQMTRDGLIEKNLITDEVNRISRRTGEQKFHHNTDTSEELHHSSSFSQDLRPVHDSISPAKSHRPPSRSSHDDTPHSEPSSYFDTPDSRTAVPSEQRTFSAEPAAQFQTAGYSAEQNTSFSSHDPIIIEGIPSAGPPIIEKHMHSGSYHAEQPHSSFHTSKQIAAENPSTFQTHSNENVFHQNQEYGNYEERNSSYRQSSASGQETSPANTSQPDQHRHRPASRQNGLSDYNFSAESYQQDNSSHAPYPLSQEQQPYAPASSYAYEEPAPQVQEETFSRSPEAMPVSDMASGRSPVYQESNRQTPFSESPHHTIPSSSTGSFAAAFMEQSHLSRYHQETERSTYQEKASQNGTPEIHAERHSTYQETASTAPAEPDNSTAQEKNPNTSHFSGYQASAEEIFAPKDNGVTLHHRGDSIEMTPIMTEVPARQKLQESHFSGHFSEKVPDERFHIEKGEPFQSERSHASSANSKSSLKVQPSSAVRFVPEEKEWKGAAIASSAEIPSSPKDNGVVIHHRADHRSKEVAPVTTDTSGTASPVEQKLQESHSVQHLSEKAPKDHFHTEKEVVLRTEPSNTPDISKSIKIKSDRASPRSSQAKESVPSSALSPSSDGNLSPPQKETSAVVNSASVKKHKEKAVKPASVSEAPSPKDNGITLNHRMEKPEFSGSEKKSDFTRSKGKSAEISEKHHVHPDQPHVAHRGYPDARFRGNHLSQVPSYCHNLVSKENRKKRALSSRQ